MRADAVSRLRLVAGGLLGMVDETLARHGAPPGHRIWPLLRAVGLLPGDAVAGIEALPVEMLRERARLLTVHGERCAALEELVRPAPGWVGPAAQAANARLATAGGKLEALAHNASELGAAWASLADLADEGRAAVARALARVLRSAQAVELTVGETEPVDRARAAADIGAEVLAEVDGFWAGALGLVRDGVGRLDDGRPRRVREAPIAANDGFAVEI